MTDLIERRFHRLGTQLSGRFSSLATIIMPPPLRSGRSRNNTA
jgi:hypothetical protein